VRGGFALSEPRLESVGGARVCAETGWLRTGARLGRACLFSFGGSRQVRGWTKTLQRALSPTPKPQQPEVIPVMQQFLTVVRAVVADKLSKVAGERG